MNPLCTFLLVGCLIATSWTTCVNCAGGNGGNSGHSGHSGNRGNSGNSANGGNSDNGVNSNSINNNLRPTEWLSVRELESMPALNEVTFQQLENMPAEEGANLINNLYHVSQTSGDLTPSYVPSPSDIPAYTYTSNGQQVNFKLNQLVSNVKQQENFGNEEVTIYITGLPQQSQTVSKATRSLVQAYLQAYNGQRQQPQNHNNNGNNDNRRNNNNNNNNNGNRNNDNDNRNNNKNNARNANNNGNADSSSEEDSSESWQSQQPTRGNLIVIDLGSTINNFKRWATLDVDRTGAMIGKTIVQLTKEADVPQEIIHIVAQGIAAHVAGAAGRQYTRQTGNQLRRITALDPSRIFAKQPNTLTGLARGNADFVDAIHTSAYGLGTPVRVGDVDFYPNGPNVGVPGASNIIEASARATRYFAESVRPGNDRNFPAVAAESYQQYKNNNGHGRRVYMGIGADYDVEGDYILQVNPKSPFGRSAPAQKQNNYHGVHQNWNKQPSQDY